MKTIIPETIADFDRTRVIERPDGFYWRVKGGTRESGPFDTLVEAVEDMQAGDEAALEPGETLAQAEAEIGMSDWIDPETGAPAEEQLTRLEDH